MLSCRSIRDRWHQTGAWRLVIHFERDLMLNRRSIKNRWHQTETQRFVVHFERGLMLSRRSIRDRWHQTEAQRLVILFEKDWMLNNCLRREIPKSALFLEVMSGLRKQQDLQTYKRVSEFV